MSSRRQFLAQAAQKLKEAGVENPWFEAQLMMTHVLGIDSAALLAHGDIVLTPAQDNQFGRMVAQRARRKPMAYIISKKSFLHWEFIVSEDVLVPRPETEDLVELAVSELRRRFPASFLQLADVGTGCGTIGLSMLALLPLARLAAVDISEKALMVAERNAQLLGVQDRVSFYIGDLLQPLQSRQDVFHCVTANLPYIPAGEHPNLQPEVSLYEPYSALVSGDDGFKHYRRLLGQVWDLLVPGGMLFIEIGCTQAGDACKLFRDSGFNHPWVRKDWAGHDRVVWACKEIEGV